LESDARRAQFLSRHVPDERVQLRLLRQVVNENNVVNDGQPLFPLRQLADACGDTRVAMTLWLAAHYLRHFDATHCIPLPGVAFLAERPRHPWQPAPAPSNGNNGDDFVMLA